MLYIIKTKEQLYSVPLDKDWIGYDLEFSNLDVRKGTLLLMSISDEHHTYVIDCTVLSRDDLQYVKPLLENALCIGAAISIDYRYTLHHLGINIARMSDVIVLDMMLRAGVYTPNSKEHGSAFSLQSIAWRRLGVTLDKEIRKEFIHYTGSLSEQAYVYAGKDTQYLKQIYDQQCAEIQKLGLEKIQNLEERLLSVTALMEYQGIPLDINELKALEAPFQRYIKTCEKMFQDIFIRHGAAHTLYFGKNGYKCLNVRSRDQVIQAFNKLGLNVTSLSSKELAKWDYKNRKHVDHVSFHQLLAEEDEDIADAIENFGGYDNPYLKAYAFYKRAEKLMSAYVKGLQQRYDPDTGRIYPWFRQCGARATGRYSSDIQQIPKDSKLRELGLDESIRSCFHMPKGKKLLIADYAQIELVILAELSGDQLLIKELLTGDVHTVVARDVLGEIIPIAKNITPENKKTYPFDVLRDFSKIISYGIIYGITDANLSEQAQNKLGSVFTEYGKKPSQKQWQTAIDQWKRTFPDAGRTTEEASRNAVTKGFTESILGRKRFYDLAEIRRNRWSFLAAQREGSNQRIQSTSADMTKLAMLLCFERLDRTQAQVILSVHDEIGVESTKKYAPHAAYVLKTSMEDAAKQLLPTLGKYVQVQVHISNRYNK